MVTLENNRLRCVLDPGQAGAAVSILDKSTGEDLAICQGYRQRRHPALMEILAGEALAEGRVDAALRAYTLEADGRDADGTRFAVFRGQTPDVSIQKAVRLRPDDAVLRVDLSFTNQTTRRLVLAGWIASGVRIPDQDCTVYAPTPGGTASQKAAWHRNGSSSMKVPVATGGWTGAVSQRPDHAGLYLAAPSPQIEAVWNWLGKFPGFTLGMGWPRRAVDPGQTVRIPYAMAITGGLPRLDGATMDLAGGLAVDLRPSPVGGWIAKVSAHLFSHQARQGWMTVAVRALGVGGRPRRQTGPWMEWPTGQPLTFTTETVLPAEDTYELVVTAAARTCDAIPPLRMVRLLTVGQPRRIYRLPRPRLDGTPHWAPVIAERPLPPRTQQCNRRVRHPMIPWMTPAARPTPLKVLFIGEVSFNTALYRDLSRRGDFAWRFVNVWGTGDLLNGPYGKAEVLRARRLLKRFRPDCILTAGLRFAEADPRLLDDLWRHAQRGGGLVMVGRDEDACHGPWPGRLAAEAQAEDIDLAEPLRSLFEAGVAPGPIGTWRSYRVGTGRIVQVDKQLDWPVLDTHGDAGPRNDLLPRYRGKTELPDWEYHFLHYLHAIRHAAQVRPAVTVDAAQLQRDTLVVHCCSTEARTVCMEYELLSTDRLLGRRGQVNCPLAAGTQAMILKLAPLPAAEYTLHVWALDGPVATPRACMALNDSHLLRESHDRPVLDVNASCQTLQGPLAITRITVEAGRQAVPSALSVTVSGESAWLERAQLEVEWHNGLLPRVVWRRQCAMAGRGTHEWRDIAFDPVSPRSWVAVRVCVDGVVLAIRGQAVHAWTPGCPAEQELVFLTAAGGEHDWYGTRMMQPWAETEAAFDFTYLCYGLPDHGFPWKRGQQRRLDPPIVNEQILRDTLAPQLKHAFEDRGHAYINMCDEFMLCDEYDWSTPTLNAFRAHLATQYGDLAALNAQWGTAYTDFGVAEPQVLAEARRTPDNPSRWLDFRLFMDACVNRRLEIALELAAAINPQLRVGDSGAYAPGVSVGINHFMMMQASTFTMSYLGLRADWARSFLRPDAIMGTWTGYGRDDPSTPWQSLFAHDHVLAWWGYLLHKRLTAHTGMSVIHLDLTPSGRFRQVGAQQREIRDGLGRLLLQATEAPVRILIAYSQSSVYATELLGERYEDGANAATVLCHERTLRYRFLADEQVRAGALDQARDALLVLPNVDALDESVVRGYVQALARGCHVFADIMAGSRDGHGRLRLHSPLDAALGLDRAQARAHPPTRFEPIRWTPHAPPLLRAVAGQMVRALSGVRADDSVIWARFADGEPAVLVTTTARGSLAVTLNTRLPWVSANQVAAALNPEDRPDELSPNQTIGALLDHVLRHACLAPHAAVQTGANTPRMIARFDAGQARYFGLLLGDDADTLNISLPHAAHTYDVRQGRYLGHVHRFTDVVARGELAKVYAQLPYAVARLEADLRLQATAGGQCLLLTGRVVTDQGETATQAHVIHVTFTAPDRVQAAWHRHNLDAPRGQFALSLPLALDPPVGSWRVDLRDAASGIRASLRLTCRPNSHV